MKILFLSVLSSFGWFIPAFAADPPAPVPPAQSVEFHHWKQGDEPLKLIRKEEGFCALTSVTGNFEGAGEIVRVYIEEDGYWYLGGTFHQQDVAADCIVVRYPVPAAMAAAPAPAPADSVAILAASYSFGSDYADVTERVRELVQSTETFQANPGWLQADPHPYWNKALVIFCEVGGKKALFSVGEGESVSRELIFKNARFVPPEPPRVAVGGGALEKLDFHQN